MNLTARVKRLETRTAASRTPICSVCHWPIGSDAVPSEQLLVTLEWPGWFDEEKPGDPIRDVCGSCGRQLTAKLAFDDAG